MAPKKKQPSFEEMLDRLEALVALMETGGQSLEETVKLYEEGAALEKALEKQLEQAKQRLTMVKLKDGDIVETEVEDGE